MFDKKRFDSDEFVVQLIAKGSFVDNGVGDGNSYLVETYTLRLNHIAVNEWIFSETMNCREVYDTDDEWEAHKTLYKAKRDAWNQKIKSAIGLEQSTEGITITQAISEVFTLVHIKINK